MNKERIEKRCKAMGFELMGHLNNIVMARRDNGLGTTWATWHSLELECGKAHLFHGHYTESAEEACQDFTKRALDEAKREARFITYNAKLGRTENQQQ